MAPPCRIPAASLSLSMESSSMAPNHAAASPHWSDAGIRWLLWALKHDPWKMRVGGGGLLLCGHCLFARSNNQSNIIVDCWEDCGERMMRSFPHCPGQQIERRKNINDEVYFAAVDCRQTIERHTTTNQKWQKQLVRCGCDGKLEKWAGWDIFLCFSRRSD
jgi:hypothetical protein